MGTHSIAEAKTHLSALIERAGKGEEVVITRHGNPVARLSAIEPAPRLMTEAELDQLAANAMQVEWPPGLDAVTLVRQLRDEADR